MFNKEITIGNKKVGENHPAMIVAELSGNHNGDYNRAIEIIHAAKEAGADAIKLQTYTADTITIDCDKPWFMTPGDGLWAGRTLHNLYEEAYTPWEWQKKIRDYVKSKGKAFISSPFDLDAVEFLEEIGTDAFKIASFEITDIPLIEKAASYGKPIIISTGIAHKEDIDLAVDTCRQIGNEDVILLKCTSEYPTPWEDVNLGLLSRMAEDYDCIVGISDHTLGDLVASSSIVLGAKVIEKHFILDRKLGGPDAAFSMEPEEFSALVDHVHTVEKILGNAQYQLSPGNEGSRRFMRSLYVVEDVKQGDVITGKNVASIRPGFGLHPKYLKQILGKKLNRDVEKGSRFSLDMID